jgi:uncharacterized membrane protein YfcA
MANDILDYPQKRRKKNTRFIQIAFVLAIVCIAYWFLGGMLHLPFSGISLLVSLALLLFVTTMRFAIKKRRKPHDYFYTLGKLLLIPAIYFNILGIMDPSYLVWGAFVCFGVGVLSLFIKKKPS